MIHEDQDMMAAFNVTKLQDFGYEEVTDFGDPEDPRWAAKPFVQTDFRGRSGPFTPQAITARVQEIALEQPYSELAEVEEALQEAWMDGDAEKRDISSPDSAGPVPRYRRFIV